MEIQYELRDSVPGLKAIVEVLVLFNSLTGLKS